MSNKYNFFTVSSYARKIRVHLLPIDVVRKNEGLKINIHFLAQVWMFITSHAQKKNII